MKKWITNSAYGHYLTVAVRTAPKGMAGISLILMDLTMEGVTK
jgi:alkylation response protein AidB-like acyl-CoA dehydrogenase